MAFRSLVGVLLASFVVAVPASALAAESEDAKPAVATPESFTHLHLGATLGGTNLGPQAGATLLLRYGAFSTGVVGSATGFVDTKAGGGLVLGGSLYDNGQVRIETLGEFGVHRHHQNDSWITKNPGASAEIPYAGLRLGFHWRLKPTSRVTNGMWLFGSYDLGTATRSYDFLDKDHLPDHDTQTLGGKWLLGIGYQLGFNAL